jgi:hypothetical protein
MEYTLDDLFICSYCREQCFNDDATYCMWHGHPASKFCKNCIVTYEPDEKVEKYLLSNDDDDRLSDSNYNEHYIP